MKHVGIIAADGSWKIADEMLTDQELRDSVEVIGAHYPGTTSSSASVASGKKLWASEDYSTFNDNIGNDECSTTKLHMNCPIAILLFSAIVVLTRIEMILYGQSMSLMNAGSPSVAQRQHLILMELVCYSLLTLCPSPNEIRW